MKKKTPLWVPVLGVSVVLALFAFLSLSTGNPNIGKQKKLQTLTTLTGLQQAMERYHSEYSKLPDIGMSGDEMRTEGQAGIELLTVLLGKEETGDKMQNPRHIPFLNVTVSKNKKKGGLVYSSGPNPVIEGLYDAWGNPFRVIVDSDLDGTLRFDCGGKPVTLKKAAAVISPGPDGIEGIEEDVKSW